MTDDDALCWCGHDAADHAWMVFPGRTACHVCGCDEFADASLPHMRQGRKVTPPT